jgi:hypothetical protein
MSGRISVGGRRKQRLAQFIFEGRECHGCDLEALDVKVSALLTRLSFVLLRCKDQLAHAGVELRIRIVLHDERAVLSEIENWSELPVGLQKLLIIELELPANPTGLKTANAA